MTRILTLLLACLTLSSAATAQSLTVGQINSYLAGIRSAKADFVQANPDNTLAQGVLFLKKPGKIRYEYTVPDDSLVIADGRVLGIFDRRSNRGAQRYDLKRTPLDLLLRANLDLTQAGVVRDIRSDGVQTRLIAADPENPKAGTIMMVFTANPIELRQWVVTDNRGKTTTVILNNLNPRARVPDSLFDIRATEAAIRR